MTRYTYETDIDLSDDGDHETEVKVSFSVEWGTPETGRGYMACPYAYDPGSGDTIYGIKVEALDGRPVNDGDAATVLEIVARLQMEHHDAMLAEAADERQADRERAAEYRAEAAREAF